MTGDRVYWHEGERTARVPASCIEAIVATATGAPKVQAATAVAVFTTLALHVDGSGEGARPKAETIADLLGMSAPQVRRCIGVCIDAGVVTKAPRVINGRKVGNVYTLTRPQAHTPNAPQGAPTNAPQGSRQTRPQARSIEQTTEQTKEEQTSISRDPDALFEVDGPVPTKPDPLDGFEEFWSLYPRKVAKGAARKVWPKAVEAAGGSGPILDGARRYAAERSDEDPKFTAHPSTWLNQERWGDDPTKPAEVPGPLRGVDQDRSGPEGRIEL